MALIYEVTLHVRADVADAFLAWLRGHSAQVAALPGFASAQILAVETDTADERSWCVHYELRDRRSLDAYFKEHAPRMRADGIERFGDAFRAERRILLPLEG